MLDNCIIVHSTSSSALTVECSPRNGPAIPQRSMANIVNTMHTQMYTTTEPDVRATFFANYYVKTSCIMYMIHGCQADILC